MAEPHTLTLELLPGTLAICRLDAAAAVPTWATGVSFLAVVRTRAELSIMCDAEHVPPDVASTRGWRVLAVSGPLDFALVGVLLAVAAPLADAGVSIMPVATYDTDYVLVQAFQLGAAVAALRAAGHVVVGDDAS